MPKSNKQLNEFVSSDEQSSTADPIAKTSARPADRSDNGENGIPDFPTKIEAINYLVNLVNGMPKEKIPDLFKGMADMLSPEKTKRPADNMSNAETLDQMRRSPTSASVMSAEDVEAIFGSEELSEEFKSKVTVVFEAAVNAKVAMIEAKLEEKYEQKLEEEVEQVTEKFATEIDAYLSEATKEWLEENEMEIQESLKTELTEEFMVGLKNLFEQHYIDVPDSKVDVVEELVNKVQELETQVKTLKEENDKLSDIAEEAAVEDVFAKLTEGLALTQIEKLKTLVEGVTYSTVEEFEKKASIIKETYFSNKSGKESVTNLLNEANGEDVDDNKTSTPNDPFTVSALDYLSKF